jgi:coproporphyrinogen III oxidase
MARVDSHADDVLRGLDTAAALAMEACGMAMVGHAVDLVPVVTSNLRNSVTHVADERTAIVGTNVEYAPYVELRKEPCKKHGTTHEFLVPAVRDHVPEYKKLILEYLGGKA